MGKDSDAGRDWVQEKGTTEDEMAGWHHWLDGRESEWTLGVGDGQGGLVYCDSWVCKESDTTERLNWTELNWLKVSGRASRWLSGKETACQCGRYRFDPWVRKTSWRRTWQPTPVFLPRKSLRQKNLESYSSGSCRVRQDLATKQQQEGLKTQVLKWADFNYTLKPGRLLSVGSLRVGHDWTTSLSLFTFMHWRRKWQPTPVFLPGESQGQRSLVGFHVWDRTEWDMTDVT